MACYYLDLNKIHRNEFWNGLCLYTGRQYFMCSEVCTWALLDLTDNELLFNSRYGPNEYKGIHRNRNCWDVLKEIEFETVD